MRSADGSEEVRLESYAHFADSDALSRVVLERMVAGISTRQFPRTQEPVGSEVEAEAARPRSRGLEHFRRRST